jgi:hypothetical protein
MRKERILKNRLKAVNIPTSKIAKHSQQLFTKQLRATFPNSRLLCKQHADSIKQKLYNRDKTFTSIKKSKKNHFKIKHYQKIH